MCHISLIIIKDLFYSILLKIIIIFSRFINCSFLLTIIKKGDNIVINFVICALLRLGRLRTIDLTASVSAPGNLHLRISRTLQNLVEPYAALWSGDPARRLYNTTLYYVLLEYNWEFLPTKRIANTLNPRFKYSSRVYPWYIFSVAVSTSQNRLIHWWDFLKSG